LVAVLKSEDRIAAEKVRLYVMNPSQGARLVPRKKIYQKNEIQLKRLIMEFENNPNPTDDELCAHLFSLQNVLAKKKIEQYDDFDPENDMKEGSSEEE